jgi:DNA-directed RNA polymerase specialized sigma24 family protein
VPGDPGCNSDRFKCRSTQHRVREELPTDEQPRIDDQEWWEWLLGYRDPRTVADLLPADESDEGVLADEADGPEMTARPMPPVDDEHRVWHLLGELPIVQRQTLILQALDGLAAFEIAMAQDRPESEVKGDIEAARRTLAEQLLAGTAAMNQW